MLVYHRDGLVVDMDCFYIWCTAAMLHFHGAPGSFWLSCVGLFFPGNLAPVISFGEKPVVFIGQDVRLRIRVNDPDGSRLILSIDRKDAFISQSGLFQWRAIANDVEGGAVRTEVFMLTARDECNATATSKLEVRRPSLCLIPPL